MDGFTGLETATTEEPPEAVAVIDPFHVVRLAGDALDQCRRRVQQQTCGHRGRTGDPLRLPPDVAHRRRTAHRQAEDQAAGAVHDRQARRRGGRLVGLPANDRCVPAPRPQTGRTRSTSSSRSARHCAVAHPARSASSSRSARHCTAEPPTSPPTPTGPAPETAPPRPSKAGSNTRAAAPSVSGTVSTTSPEAILQSSGFRPQRHRRL